MMKKSFKRIIAIVMSMFIILAGISVYADDYIEIASDGETKISVKQLAESDRINSSGSTIDLMGMNGYSFLSFQPGSTLTFRVNISVRGAYELYLGIADTAGEVKNYGITIDDGEEQNVSGKGGLGWYEPNYNSVLIPILETGNHTIVVRNINASLHFESIKLRFLATDMEIDDVTVNDISLVEADTFSKGSDSVKVYFSEILNEESVNDETVSLTYENEGDEKNVSASVKVAGKVLTIAIKEALKENTEYKVSLNGIKDKYGLTTVADQAFVIMTDSSDIKNGTVEATVELDYEYAVISGRYISSEGVGVLGRNVALYINEIGEIAESHAITDENGAFTINYTFPEDKTSGAYTFKIDGDYLVNPYDIEVMYITSEKEKELLDALSNMQTADEVEAFLVEYETIMGIDLDNDLLNIPNAEPVYSGLLGKDYADAGALRTEFYKYIALETINQAENTTLIEMILKSEEDCKLLGLPYDRIMLVENNKESLLSELLALPAQTDATALKNAVAPIVEKWASTEYGFSDLTIDEADKTLYQGKGVEINLGFTKKVEALKKAVFEITVSDKELLNYLTEEAETDVNLNVTVNESYLTVIAEYNGKTPISNFATLYLTAPQKTGSHTVVIKGTAEFEGENALLFTTNILEKNVNITVNKTPTQETGRVTSSQSGRGSSGISAGFNNMTISEYKAEIDNKTQDMEAAKYKFSDLEEVAWAEESIYALLDKGIISESEDNTFYPMRNITREEFVKMLVCALKLETDTATSSFKDLDKNAWYYPYIAVAEKNGLVNGDENGMFGIGENITRQDMCVMVARALEKLGFEVENDMEKFADDSSIADYAKASVYMMKKLGIIDGVGDNCFAPTDNANRAQAAKIINKVVEIAKL